MPFDKGNTYGKIGKRGKSKVNTELRELLTNMTHDVLNKIVIDELSNSDKLRFLNHTLPYLLTKDLNIDLSDNKVFTPVNVIIS